MTVERDYEQYWQQMHASFRYFPNTRYRIHLILLELRSLLFKSVLEMGCGDGSFLTQLRALYPDALLTGCDYSHEIVECNRKHNASGAEFFQLDIVDTAGVMNVGRTFDLVVCSEVIEHVPDYKAALSNLAHLTAPGGTLVLTTPTGRMWKTYKYHGHLRHFDLDPLTAELQALGFEPLRCFAYGWPFMIMQNWTAELLFDFVKSSFIEVKHYGPVKRLISEAMFQLFKLNSRRSGPGLLLVMRRR